MANIYYARTVLHYLILAYPLYEVGIIFSILQGADWGVERSSSLEVGEGCGRGMLLLVDVGLAILLGALQMETSHLLSGNPTINYENFHLTLILSQYLLIPSVFGSSVCSI